jgi:hypothetical protein
LLLKPVDRILTGPQTSQLGVRSDPKPEDFVNALNDLEWLAKIVTRYGKQHSLEIRDFVRSRGRRHAPSYRSPGTGCAGILVAFRRLDMAPHLAHVRFLQMVSPKKILLHVQASRGFPSEAS